MVYLNDRPVLLVCDDTPFVKMLPCVEGLLGGRPSAAPYELSLIHIWNFVDQLDEMNHLRGKHAEIKDVSYGGRLWIPYTPNSVPLT